MKSSTGDPAKLAKKLAEVNAEREILETRLAAEEQRILDLRKAELDEAIEAKRKEQNKLEAILKKTARQIRESLVNWYGDEVARYVMEPGRNACPASNQLTRPSRPEVELAARIDQIKREAGQLNADLRKLGVVRNA